MRRFSISFLLVLVFSLSILFAFLFITDKPSIDDSQFVHECLNLEGKTVRQVMTNENVLKRQHWQFDEPPGVLRGIHVVTKDGRSVVFSIARHANLFSKDMQWDQDFFLTCEIVDVSVRGQKTDVRE